MFDPRRTGSRPSADNESIGWSPREGVESRYSFCRNEEAETEMRAVAEGQRAADRLGERELEPVAKLAGVKPLAMLAAALELQPAQFAAVHFGEIDGLDFRRRQLSRFDDQPA